MVQIIDVDGACALKSNQFFDNGKKERFLVTAYKPSCYPWPYAFFVWVYVFGLNFTFEVLLKQLRFSSVKFSKICIFAMSAVGASLFMAAIRPEEISVFCFCIRALSF